MLENTESFRSERDVEELWDALVARLTVAIEGALQREKEPDTFLQVKESLLSFIMTLEVGQSSLEQFTPDDHTCRLLHILRLLCTLSSSFSLRNTPNSSKISSRAASRR